MPQVSIILPVFNCDKYLSQQIESLLSQTFTNFELIVVDDNSTDFSSEIVKLFQLKDERIHYYKNEFNKGISGSLNTALKYSKGELIARADGDDIHLPHRLKSQVDFLNLNNHIMVVGSNSILFNENGQIREAKYPQSSIYLAWNFISNTYFCHPSTMFRASLLKEVSGYPYVVSEDFAFFSKIVKTNQCTNLNTPLLHYRVHNKSYSKSNSEIISDFITEQYTENYRYYIPNLNFSNRFYLFQVHKLLNPLFLPIILIINFKILNKIKIDYRISIFSRIFLFAALKVIIMTWLSIFNYFKNLLLQFLIPIKDIFKS